MVTLNALPEPEEDIRSNHACFINILNILNITCYKKLLKHNLFFFSPIQIWLISWKNAYWYWFQVNINKLNWGHKTAIVTLFYVF